MPSVIFIPAQRTAVVAEGTSLLDAAAQAGATLIAPCGGEGVCGECRVRVEAGAVAQVLRGCLSLEERAQGWVLACSSRVTRDVTVQVPTVEPREAVRIVTEGAETRVRTPLITFSKPLDDRIARQIIPRVSRFAFSRIGYGALRVCAIRPVNPVFSINIL